MRTKWIITGIVGIALLGIVASRSMQVRAGEQLAMNFLADGDLLAMNQPRFLRGSGDGQFSPEKRKKVQAFRNMVRSAIGRVMVLRSEIDLSDEQKAELKKVLIGHKEDVRGALSGVIDSKRALDKAVTTGQSEDDLKKAADNFGSSVSKLALEFAKTRQDARKVMTDDQRSKIDETKAAIWKSVDTFRAKVK